MPAVVGQSVSVAEHRQPAAPLVTPEIAGPALVELAQADAANVAPAYVLTGEDVFPGFRVALSRVFRRMSEIGEMGRKA